MYTREQASKIKAQFWTSFGQYMKPIPGASGLPVNWINYKTGIKHIRFTMNADNKSAVIAIEIAHPKDEERTLYFDQFLSLSKVLNETTGFTWQWNETLYTEYKTISSISQRLDGVNIFNEADWPAIISFFKPRIMGLDAFWDLVKEGFE